MIGSICRRVPRRERARRVRAGRGRVPLRRGHLASTRTQFHAGTCLRARGLEFPARERHRGIVAVAADLREERAKIEGTESQCDDLAFAELRLGGALTTQKRNLGVKFQGQLFTAGPRFERIRVPRFDLSARIPEGDPHAKLGNASGESDAV